VCALLFAQKVIFDGVLEIDAGINPLFMRRERSDIALQTDAKCLYFNSLS